MTPTRRVFVIALCFGPVGCGRIVGEFSVDEGAAGAAGAEPSRASEFGWVPGIPDPGFEDECVECAKQSCADERNRCLDPAVDCYERLDCASRCEDPPCLFKCEADQFNAGVECEADCASDDAYCLSACWEGWERYERLRNCLFTTEVDLGNQCDAECNVGDNFHCRERFEWPQSGNDVSVWVIPNSLATWEFPRAIPGLDVYWCNVAMPCESNALFAGADLHGVARLERRRDEGGGVEPLKLTVVGSQGFPQQGLYVEKPAAAFSGRRRVMVPRPGRFPEGSTFVIGDVVDCLLDRHKPNVELRGERGTLEAEYLLRSPEEAWIDDLHDADTAVFRIRPEPPFEQYGEVVAVDADGVELSSARVTVRGDWITTVRLYPTGAP